MAQITQTLSSALADLLHFAIIFFVLFINFAIAGHALFGHEVEEWSTVTKALQSALGMAWGRVEFTPLYDISPIASAIWLMGYVLSMVMISMNLLLAIIADHYGGIFHANNAGDKGYDICGQFKAMFYEGWWNCSFVVRAIYRIVRRRLPTKFQRSRGMPRYAWEGDRLEIPYDELYVTCELDPLGFLTERALRDAGCDKATAKHLLDKCQREVLRHEPETYPLELLFDEFDESMTQYYFAMDAFTNDLRTWFADKSNATARMIPRQTKLNELSKQIEVAQHIEHKHHHHHSAATTEGEGAHHHHHRTGHGSSGHGDHSASQSQGTRSAGQSLGPSRQLSRAPSNTGLG